MPSSQTIRENLSLVLFNRFPGKEDFWGVSYSPEEETYRLVFWNEAGMGREFPTNLEIDSWVAAFDFDQVADAGRIIYHSVDIDGIACSIQPEDEQQVLFVWMKYQLDPAGFLPTQINFINTSQYVVTTANIDNFLTLWVAERNLAYLVEP